MKKFLLLIVVVLFSFTACEYIDETAVHNGLVDQMDYVLTTGEAFYADYYAIEDGENVTFVSGSYADFSAAVTGLDNYFTNVTFAESQQVFVTEYNELYKPSIDNYMVVAGDFITFIEENGYTFDSTEDMITAINDADENFVEVHNSLIDTINLQSTEI